VAQVADAGEVQLSFAGGELGDVGDPPLVGSRAGLVALRARNYDANTQSFTTRDPLAGVVGSNNLTNPYHYADNDPINRHDPLGLRGEQKDPCGTSWADKWITDNVLSHFDDSKCFNSGTGARAVKESWPTILALSGAGGCVAASSASLFVAAPVCLGVFGLLGGGGQAAHDCGKKLTECGDEILLGAKSGGAAGLAAGLTIAAGALTGAPIVLVAGFASGNAAWAGASVAGRGFSAADYRNNFLLGMGVAVAVEGLGYAARGMKTIGGKALESTRTIASERNWGTSVKTLVADEAGSARLPFGREPTAAPATTPSGEQLHDIPTGSRGGVGSGNPIPRSLRDEWFPDGQAPPACSYCRTRPGSTLDHVEPKSLGGDLTPDNITPACPRCNSSKGARVAPKTPPAEYVGPWPPPHWPQPMKDWWNQTYGGGS
jgi:RHS repeat-associated protein